MGIRLMLFLYRVLGRQFFKLALYPVIGYYYFSKPMVRQASAQFYQQWCVFTDYQYTIKGFTYQHIYHFGLSMLDKLAAWRGDIKKSDVEIIGNDLLEQTIASREGCIVMGAHLGNLELCRALCHVSVNVKINALVATDNAENFNQIMRSINPDSHLNLIHLKNIGPETAILLDDKLEQGEWLVILADRTSHDATNRVIQSHFMGKPAQFPEGPFLLPVLLKRRCFSMFAFADKKNYRLYFEPMAIDTIDVNRKQRQSVIETLVDEFAVRLTKYAVMYPRQWFNYYDFWKLNVD